MLQVILVLYCNPKTSFLKMNIWLHFWTVSTWSFKKQHEEKIYEKGYKGYKKSKKISLFSEMCITIVLDSKNLYPKKWII
jgi:hypothetical protein